MTFSVHVVPATVTKYGTQFFRETDEKEENDVRLGPGKPRGVRGASQALHPW